MRQAAARGLVLCGALGSLLAVTAQAHAAVQTYGPVRAKESLSQIAYALRPQKTRLCTYQTIAALYRANPDAFAGSPEHIKPGSVLRVPEAQDIVAIPEAEAYAVFHGRAVEAAPVAKPMVQSKRPDAPMPVATAMPRPALKAEVAMAPAPAAVPTTAPVQGAPDIRRRTGEQRQVPGDTEPLPDPSDWNFELLEQYHDAIRATALDFRGGLASGLTDGMNARSARMHNFPA